MVQPGRKTLTLFPGAEEAGLRALLAVALMRDLLGEARDVGLRIERRIRLALEGQAGVSGAVAEDRTRHAGK